MRIMRSVDRGTQPIAQLLASLGLRRWVGLIGFSYSCNRAVVLVDLIAAVAADIVGGAAALALFRAHHLRHAFVDRLAPFRRQRLVEVGGLVHPLLAQFRDHIGLGFGGLPR